MNPAPEIFKGHLLKWDHDEGLSLPQPECTHLILNAFSSWPKARLLILMGQTTEYGRNKYSGDKWIVFLTKQSTASSELSREVVSGCERLELGLLTLPPEFSSLLLWGARVTMWNKEVPDWKLTESPQIRLGAVETEQCLNPRMCSLPTKQFTSRTFPSTHREFRVLFFLFLFKKRRLFSYKDDDDKLFLKGTVWENTGFHVFFLEL